MKKTTFLFAIVMGIALLMGSHAGAGQVQQFELTDGSVITGELVSFGSGVFTVKSATLGTLKIDASRVRSVGQSGAAASGAAGQLNAIRQQMQGDAGIMKMITDLQNDPDLKKALNDPALMRAVQSGDLEALQNSSLIKGIMNNPDVKKIVEQMTAN